MKAAVYYTNTDVRVEEMPKPTAGEGEIVVKTNACGVCVADTMEWYNKPKAPVVLGHEAVYSLPSVQSHKLQARRVR